MKKIMIIAVCVLFVGCSFDEHEIAMAIDGCKNNGGLHSMTADGGERRAACKNGVSLYLREE